MERTIKTMEKRNRRSNAITTDKDDVLFNMDLSLRNTFRYNSVHYWNKKSVVALNHPYRSIFQLNSNPDRELAEIQTIKTDGGYVE